MKNLLVTKLTDQMVPKLGLEHFQQWLVHRRTGRSTPQLILSFR